MPGLHFQYMTPNIDGMYLDLTVRRLGSVFLIQYTRDSILAPGLFDVYLQLSKDYDEVGDPSATERLIKPFEAYIDSFSSTDQGYLLTDYLYPRYFVLEATAGPEDTEITPRFKELKELLPGDYLHRQPELAELTDWVPNIYSSRQVCLPGPPGPDARLSGPGKVLVDGKPYFFKPGATPRELRTDKGTSGPARLVGILLTFIETDKPKWRGTLHDTVRGGGCSPDTLSRWARELEVCVGELHRAGVIWGDAKPYNVLVDSHDDIWIIDFGGAYTDGWVDEDKSETMEGDRQGVARIKAFLEGSQTQNPKNCLQEEAETVNAAQN